MKSRLLSIAAATTLAMSTLSVATSIGAPAAQAATCTTVADIGRLIFVDGYMKGSGSYTSCAGAPLRSVELRLYMQDFTGHWMFMDYPVIKYPKNGGGSDPNVLSFSIKDYRCHLDIGPYAQFRVRLYAKYKNGGSITKYSNKLNVPCIV